MDKLFSIIHEDDELLVVNKPAGLVCHPTKTDKYSSLIGRVRLHLGPDVHPHLVNRLDRETSGIVVVAKQDETARELRRIWENRHVEKDYLALVHGHVDPGYGVIDAPLGKDERSRVAIKDCVCADGVPARTEFWVEQLFGGASAAQHGTKPWAGTAFYSAVGQTFLSAGGGDFPVATTAGLGAFSLLRVRPHTGRKHQIRIHLAHIGHPIVGDKIYGGDEDLYLALVENRLTAEQRSRLILPQQALHACEVRFVWHARQVTFRAEPEEWFAGIISALRS